MLQPGQLPGQGLVGLHQLRELPGHHGDLPGLAPHHDDQLIARHLLQPGHPKIKPHTSQSHRNRHADTTDRCISTPTGTASAQVSSRAECLRDDVELATFEWVDWYNHRRIHSSCQSMPPVEYEAAFHAKNEPANVVEA